MSVQPASQIDQPGGNGSFGKSSISTETLLTYEELLEKHKKEVEAHASLQKTYDEMQIMVRHQQKMFAVVKQLYNDQVEAASTDAVTGLPNHRAIMSRIEEEIAQYQKGRSFAVLFIDLDHFKQVNDSWGHRAGDTILQEVGHRCSSDISNSSRSNPSLRCRIPSKRISCASTFAHNFIGFTAYISSTWRAAFNNSI